MPSAEEFRADQFDELDGVTGGPFAKADRLFCMMSRQLSENPNSADDISIAADWVWSEVVHPAKPPGFAAVEDEEAHGKIFEAIELYFSGLAKQKEMGS